MSKFERQQWAMIKSLRVLMVVNVGLMMLHLRTATIAVALVTVVLAVACIVRELWGEPA